MSEGHMHCILPSAVAVSSSSVNAGFPSSLTRTAICGFSPVSSQHKAGHQHRGEILLSIEKKTNPVIEIVLISIKVGVYHHFGAVSLFGRRFVEVLFLHTQACLFLYSINTIWIDINKCYFL